MRSVSQIFAEAIQTRNNYLQLTELNSGRSESKMSILNLMTYVVSVVIFTYETILDVFETRIATVLSERINGTAPWYAAMAKMFQYNQATGTGDELIFDENTLKVNYKVINESHRIITNASWYNNDDSYSLTIKAVKKNENSNEINYGTIHQPLSDNELTEFKKFMHNIKFVGSDILCESSPGDILIVIADASNPVYYNSQQATADQVIKAITDKIVTFIRNFSYNGILSKQSVLDAISEAENVSDLGSNIRVYIKSWNTLTGTYDDAVEVQSRIRLSSGFLKIIDTDSTVTINSNNITLVPISSLEI